MSLLLNEPLGTLTPIHPDSGSIAGAVALPLASVPTAASWALLMNTRPQVTTWLLRRGTGPCRCRCRFFAAGRRWH